MRNLDGAFADSDEPAVRQSREDVGHVGVALQIELGERSATAHGGVALVLRDETQHQRAHERLALVRDPAVRSLRQPRDGTVHTPDSR